MSKIVLDRELIAKLKEATKSVEIADEDGTVIGSFVPNEAYERIMAFILRPSTDQELTEARAEMLRGGGVSAQELLARLDDVKKQYESRS
jgi:hypothetical protein